MTKTDVFRPCGGRKHVANFDGVIGNNDPVNEEFDELTLLLECGVIQTKPDPVAEILERSGESGDFTVAVNLGLQLALLLRQGMEFLSQVLATTLVLSQGHDRSQVSLRETV